MKKALLTLLAGLPVIALAQSGTYTIKGKVGSLNAPAKIFLYHSVNGKYQNDSTVLKNGAFEFTGPVTEPSQASLTVKRTDAPVKRGDAIDATMLYVVQGTTVVNTKDSLKKAGITGTPLNIEYKQFQAAQDRVNNKYEALEAKTKAATEEQRNSDAFKAQQASAEKAIDAEYYQVSKDFIKQHPNSVISLSALENYTYVGDYSELEPMFSHLSPAIQNSESGKKYAAQLEKLKAVALGKTAPDFAQADTNGIAVKLSSFRGKYVLVDFWASWCGPCRRENPNVVKAYSHYKDKNFTVLGVSLDRPGAKDKWLAAIHKDGLNWTQVSDLQFWKNEVAQQYGVQAIPQNFLLDPDGKIIAKGLHGDDLENKLAEIFGKTEKAKAE